MDNAKRKSWAEFTLLAIAKLAKKKADSEERHKGIHNVYSGFNGACREYFGLKGDEGTATLIAEIRKLVDSKVIETRSAKGGFMLYKFGDSTVPGTKRVLDAILAN